MFKRIIVVGTSGSGKSTLAKQLAEKLNIAHIELDAIHWQADWQPAEDFHERVLAAMATATEGWSLDGNYSRVRALTWAEADTVIWLNYPAWILYWRIITRTLKRVLFRKKLWNDNRETFHTAFLSKDSMILWVHNTYKQRRELYGGIIASNQYPHIKFIVFKHPRETELWLNSLPNGQ